MDFAKAFDRVNHSLLVHKLYHYSIPGNENTGVTNLLSDHRQAVLWTVPNQTTSVEEQESHRGQCLDLAYF